MALVYQESAFDTLSRAVRRGAGLEELQSIVMSASTNDDPFRFHDGYPILHYACQFGDHDVATIRYLSEQQPDAIFTRDLVCLLPVQYAIIRECSGESNQKKNLEVVKFLLSHHAEVERHESFLGEEQQQQSTETLTGTAVPSAPMINVLTYIRTRTATRNHQDHHRGGRGRGRGSGWEDHWEVQVQRWHVLHYACRYSPLKSCILMRYLIEKYPEALYLKTALAREDDCMGMDNHGHGFPLRQGYGMVSGGLGFTPLHLRAVWASEQCRNNWNNELLSGETSPEEVLGALVSANPWSLLETDSHGRTPVQMIPDRLDPSVAYQMNLEFKAQGLRDVVAGMRPFLERVAAKRHNLPIPIQRHVCSFVVGGKDAYASIMGEDSLVHDND